MKSAIPGMKSRYTGPVRNMAKPRLRQTVARIHAFRLSVNKYHWLYLERFHPLEQALRFSTEFLPFYKAGAWKYRSPRKQSAWEAIL
jgi:hypothetical protein